jgi:hypothetical protein
VPTYGCSGTWKPSVAIVGSAPTGPAPLGTTYTKTSLAYNSQPQVWKGMVGLFLKKVYFWDEAKFLRDF